MAVNKDGNYFDNLETMSEPDRDKYRNQALAAHISHTYLYSPAVKRLFDRAGCKPEDIKTVKDLEKLPITRKTDLIKMQQAELPYGGVAAIPKEEVERVFVSPGPIYEMQPSNVEWFAKTFWAAGIRKGDVVINTFTYHLSPAGILFHEAIRHCGATVVVAGTGNTDLQVQIIKDLDVTAFVGTPSFLITVINRAGEMELDFKKDLRVKKAWFTGEMLSPTLRRDFEVGYGIDTYQAYAVTEPGGCIAYECSEKAGMHLMDEYITEIVNPQTGEQLGPGEVGEIVTTQLGNKDWGLIRFGTGDLSSYITESCSCGRTAYRLTGILGRADDAVKVRGMFVVGKQAGDTIGGFREVACYQLLVGREKHRDILTLRLELADAGADTLQLGKDINDRFQDVCRIKIDKIDVVATGTIPGEKRGIVDERKWE